MTLTPKVNPLMVGNSFCATGAGGGVDPTCGKSGGGAGGGGVVDDDSISIAAVIGKNRTVHISDKSVKKKMKKTKTKPTEVDDESLSLTEKIRKASKGQPQSVSLDVRGGKVVGMKLHGKIK